MKVTFIYTDYGQYNQNNFNRGVAMLSSCLKKEGHRTSLVHISKRISKKDFVMAVKDTRPDLVAFSFISNMFPQVKQFSVWIKEMGIPAIHGGMHPTVAPEECLAEEGIDVIARGEGELVITDFCRAMESSGRVSDIPNIWVKEGLKIYRNPPRPLIEDLDTLPYPDYEIFNYEDLEEGAVHKILVTQASRGCDYSCTYCCNPLLKDMYKNSGKFLRHYNVDRLLDEIEDGLKRYPFLKEVRFYDDTITQDKRWFGEFAVKYKNRINLPYSGNERVENIDIRTAVALKESGCFSLDLGIESGSQFIRERYMNRRMSNEKIVEAFHLLRSNGIKTNSFNILGMVGETPGTVLETIKLNAVVDPAVTFNAYFYPFKGTAACSLVLSRHYMTDYSVSSFFERPVVELDTISSAQLKFFYKYFYLLMSLYRTVWAVYSRNSVVERFADAVFSSRYFPYFAFNFIHFGKEDVIVFLRRNPGLYISIRKVYRFIKSDIGRSGSKNKIAPRIEQSSIKRILVVNLGGIGDILLSTPALRAIRNKYPEARISLIAVPRAKEVAGNIPYIDEIFLFDIAPGIRAIWSNIRVLTALRERGFDLAVNMRTLVSRISALKISLLLNIINPKIKAGRNTEGRGGFLDIKINETDLGNKHEMDYDIDMAMALGAEAPDRELRFEIGEEDNIKVWGFLKDNGISPDDAIVGIDLGGKPSHKWPIENYIKTIEEINERVECKFVITDDRQDGGLADRLIVKPGVKIVNAMGKFNIKELASLIKMCGLYISNDTGPMHIAAILKVPLIAIFGPGFLTRFDPRVISKRAIVLYKGAACAPCNKKTCGRQDCLRAILPAEVADAALSFLRSSSKTEI